MIDHLKAEYLIEEIDTDGHAPLKFSCSDNNVYFCKYLNSMKREELVCLSYELLANRLLSELKIPTPDVAFVEVDVDCLDKEKIHKNRRLKPGNTCFGSKEVSHSEIIQSIQTFDKCTFRKFVNPFDIIRIAIFDLWVDNVDRGRDFGDGINYNLLLANDNKKFKIYAFDNAFIFGGTNQIGVFNSTSPVDGYNKLVKSPLYISIMEFISKEEFVKVVDNFLPLLSLNYEIIIKEILSQVPDDWYLTPKLDDRIIEFLSSKSRIEAVRKTILNSKNK